MKKNSRSVRMAAAFLLSAVLALMAAVSFAMEPDRAEKVFAAETAGTGTDEAEKETVSGEAESERSETSAEREDENGEDGKDTSAGSEAEGWPQETESGDGTVPEDGPGSGTVSGNDAGEKASICEERCGEYSYDRSCPVCAENYRDCGYKTPNILIRINRPEGWYNTSAVVTFSVSDIAETGNFKAALVQAKIGYNGSWTDVTEDMALEISENCAVYVQVTDQKGKVYEKSRTIQCFDRTKPTLNAAVSDGLLSIQVSDTDSGAKAVYVNGYEFTELTGDTLNIRLQQFDSGYEYFTISAMDRAGNMSDIYKAKNPYYKDPAAEGEEGASSQLPVSAQASPPASATAEVTEHVRTDAEGNILDSTMPADGAEEGEQKVLAGRKEPEEGQSSAEQKKQSLAEADAAENAVGEVTGKESGDGKEFYTIQAASGKTFYLIIDREGATETAYFLTEITENDLLNVTTNGNEVLPKNSAALESAIPVTDSALPGKDEEMQRQDETQDAGPDDEAEEAAEVKEADSGQKPNTVFAYMLIGLAAAGCIGGAYYFKLLHGKKEDFVEDEDEEETEDEEYEIEDEPEEESEEDFFQDRESTEKKASETAGKSR